MPPGHTGDLGLAVEEQPLGTAHRPREEPQSWRWRSWGTALSCHCPAGREGAAERVQGAPRRPGEAGQGHRAAETPRPGTRRAGPGAPAGCVRLQAGGGEAEAGGLWRREVSRPCGRIVTPCPGPGDRAQGRHMPAAGARAAVPLGDPERHGQQGLHAGRVLPRAAAQPGGPGGCGQVGGRPLRWGAVGGRSGWGDQWVTGSCGGQGWWALTDHGHPRLPGSRPSTRPWSHCGTSCTWT